MSRPEDKPNRFEPADSNQTLRQRAEAAFSAAAGSDVDDLPRDEIRRLLHELGVHQIELEMQNEDLRRTQEALLEARARYFDLYDLAPVGYLTVDEANVILESNLTAATMLGRTRQVLTKSPFTRYILAEDQDRFYLHRRRLFATGEMQQAEVRLTRLDGSVFWVRLDASLAFDARSNLPLCLMTLIDVDEAKRQAGVMELNSVIVNKATDAIFTTGTAPDYLITSWNPGAETIYGWSADEAIGRSARLLCSEYPGQTPDSVCREMVAAEYTGEVIQTTKDGDRVYIDSRVVARSDQQGNVTGWISVNRNVTAQKQAEATLLRSERSLAQAQQIGHIGSWEWDIPRAVIFWSDELYRIFGVAENFLLTAESIASRIHPDDRTLNDTKVQEILATGHPVDYEFRIVWPDGRIRYVAQRIIAESNLDGALERLTGTTQDITERIRSDVEREALRVRLAEADRLEMVGRLAGGIAHDFNNMLAVILMRVEMGMQTAAATDPILRHLGEIYRVAQRSVALVRQLLGYAGRQVIAPRALNLNTTIEGMLTLLRELLGEEVGLLFRAAPGLWTVFMDPSQVDQILVNLCINARDAIRATGRVIVKTANVETEQEIWATGFVITPGDYIVLSVTDDGCGMEPEILEHIFEPFYTTKPVGKGRGLGLATVYGIVKQNGGDIQVYSEPGIGSTFNIYLPRHHADVLPDSDVGGRVLTMGCGERILLVEDKQDLLHSTAEVLRQLGYTVTETESPVEAERLAAAGTIRFDLLVTDIIMPHMDGRELALRVAAHQPHVKCLYISGYPAEFLASRGLLGQDVHLLQKPFSLSHLAGKVRIVLDG